jgi:hypothetical protein
MNPNEGTTCSRHDWDLHQPTEDMVNVQATIPHHVDDHFSSIEDEGGTGEVDSPGG